jgi:T4-like virus tail tube protein gp19
MPSIADYLGAAGSALKGTGATLVNQLAQGNIEGAISGALQAPGQLLGSLGSFGGTSLGDDFAGINARGDAVQSWCWYAVMPDINNNSALSVGVVAGINVGAPVVSLPWYYVQTANLPMRQFSLDTIKRNGHSVHYAQSYEVGTLTLGLFMDSSSKAHQYIKAWQGQVMANANPKSVQNQGNWGYPAAYKKDIVLVVLSVDKKVLLNVKLINCWPTEPSAVELTSGEATPLVQTINFAVEDVDITVNNDKGLLDTLIGTATGYATSALTGALNSQLNNIITSF